jgi:hypothetical protein
MGFNEYYEHYLSLHQNKTCRRLHLLGMVAALGLLALAVFYSWWWLLLAVPVVAYPFAWMGHFLFEKNTPASWKNPLLANLSDLRMTWDILRGRIQL